MHLDQPLSEKEFSDLDDFLMSERSPEDCMTMDSLHGFLTAIVIGPEAINMPEWLPTIWGSDPKAAPKFKNEKEAARITELIARYMNEIAITMEVAPKEFEAVFLEHEWNGKSVIDGESWAWGFLQGVELREEAWAPIWDSPVAALMRPIYLLGAEEIEEEELVLVDNPGKCDKLAQEMEAGIPEIYRYWSPTRKTLAVNTVTRDAPKVGRNDDCPCGSGKKYKKCCGADPAGE